MMNVKGTGLEVIEAQSLGSKIVLVAKLIYGDIKVNMIFESNETGDLFQVVGISFMPAEAFVQGKRALTLKPINRQAKLKKGEHLFSKGLFSCTTTSTDLANDTAFGERDSE